MIGVAGAGPVGETRLMIIADLNKLPGRVFPAQRWGRGLVGQGEQPIRAEGFSMGYSVLAPRGGQVPWHYQEQEEVYFIVEGEGEVCVEGGRAPIRAGQAVYLPPGKYHQLTNTGADPLHLLYVYCPGGDVAHWRQELEGTLPVAGAGVVPALPEGAEAQWTLVTPKPLG
jgi:mannose-6-phosphate isomerase-like protein (cupin superfamily)